MRYERLYYQIISPNRKWWYQPVFLLFRLISFFYLVAHQLRVWAYRGGIFPTRKLNCRVISVGNLTLGGTGKTPIVIMIAETLIGQGRKPAILSRGYGGNNRREVNVVCDGQKILLTPSVAGDEPVMIAEKLRNVPVLVGRDRYQTGRYAVDHFGVDTLILDDGFQHLGLKRDLNILLLDHEKPLGNGCLFPAGELREPKAQARRADLVCITRFSGNRVTPELNNELLGDIPVIKTHLRLDSVTRMDNGNGLDKDFLKNRPVAAFCGIANPDDFNRILKQAGARVVFYQAFPDHHEYSLDDLKKLEENARAAGAELVLTTDKDAVKIRQDAPGLPLYKVSIELEILEGRELFHRNLLS